MQQFSFIDLFTDLFESALRVSGDNLAHLQEHFLLYTQICYNAPILLLTGDQFEMEILICRNTISWLSLKRVAARKVLAHCRLLPLIFMATEFGVSCLSAHDLLYHMDRVRQRIGRFLSVKN